MTTPDPITASRERIEQQLEDACDEKWRRWGISWNKADELLFLRQALLQHEAIVKEEMARPFEEIMAYIREVDPDDNNKQMRHIFDIAEAAIRTKPTP